MNYFYLKLVFVESVMQSPKQKLNSGRNELKDLTQTGSVEQVWNKFGFFNFEKLRSVLLRKMVLLLKKLEGKFN